MAAISPSETSSGSGESKNGSGSELHAPKRLEHAARLALAISRASNPQVVDKGSALLGICVWVQTLKGHRRNVRKISWYCFGPIYLLIYWSTSWLVSITPQTSEPLRLWLSCRCVCCFCKYSICSAVSKTMAAISPSETSNGSGESKNGSGSELHTPKRSLSEGMERSFGMF